MHSTTTTGRDQQNIICLFTLGDNVDSRTSLETERNELKNLKLDVARSITHACARPASEIAR